MTHEELLRQPFATLPDLVRLHAGQRPRHRALVQDERVLDYEALDRLVDRIAASLQRDGVRPREAVAICAAMSIEYAAMFVGILRAGACVAPLSPSATAGQLEAMVKDSGARILFRDADLQGLERWLVAEGTKPAPVEIEPDWPFNIIYSSGTTGTPKGIVQPHAMRWMHIRRSAITGYDPDAITLLSTPLYSNTTLVSFIPTLAFGATAILIEKFDAAGYLALAEKHRVTHTMLVPVQYQRLMALPDFDRYDLSSFRVKTCTSAPFPAALKADVLKRWPGRLYDVYGLTEGGGTCVLDCTAHPDKLHTSGKPVAGHDIRLIDEQGREVAPGEAGEVVGHSPGMMTGYHNQPEKTREAEWFDATGKRFIRTGDIGRFDAEGFLTLVDRKKDMIISGGFNIYPSDLEAVVRRHPAVAEVAVVGVPSEKWGETPVAYVVKKEAVSEEALLAWANERLGKTQRLAAVRFLDALPRSPIGKVLKRELRAH
ncbi:MAG TPA: class I adenylate-forming enzyme family protein [Burkholderiales bacterium]|nr:class I adenylate-forming enzyme family protein [Burkholderiales bacterium]